MAATVSCPVRRTVSSGTSRPPTAWGATSVTRVASETLSTVKTATGASRLLPYSSEIQPTSVVAEDPPATTIETRDPTAATDADDSRSSSVSEAAGAK